MPSWLPLVTGSGGALVVLSIWVYAFMRGKIHSDGEFQLVKSAWADETKGHERTREALAVASARAEAGLKPAEIIAAVLAGQQKGIAP